MRGTGGQDRKWNFAARWIPGIPVDRAKVRLTGTYRILPNAFVGLEYNPLDDDLGLLVNWRVIEETKRRPMLMVGTSSDRIGTPSGRAYYATLSKGLDGAIGLPVAPYVGTAFGEFDDEWVFVGGLGIRWSDHLRSTHVWDSDNLHHMLDYSFEDGYRSGLLLVQQDSKYYLGVSLGLGF